MKHHLKIVAEFCAFGLCMGVLGVHLALMFGGDHLVSI